MKVVVGLLAVIGVSLLGSILTTYYLVIKAAAQGGTLPAYPALIAMIAIVFPVITIALWAVRSWLCHVLCIKLFKGEGELGETMKWFGLFFFPFAINYAIIFVLSLVQLYNVTILISLFFRIFCPLLAYALFSYALKENYAISWKKGAAAVLIVELIITAISMLIPISPSSMNGFTGVVGDVSSVSSSFSSGI